MFWADMYNSPAYVNTYENSKGRCINMSAKKNKPIKLEELTQEEKLKYEIADELGLLDRVLSEGWKSLSSKETGRIGGLLARRKRETDKK